MRKQNIFVYFVGAHSLVPLLTCLWVCYLSFSPTCILVPRIIYQLFYSYHTRQHHMWCEDTPFLDHFFKLLFGHVLTEYDSQIMCNVCNYPLVKKHPWIGSIFPTIYVKAMDKGPCKLRGTFFPTFLVLIKWVSSSLRGVPYATFHEFWYVFIL